MKSQFVRKVIENDNRGSLNIPSIIYNGWKAAGYSYCRVEYDPTKDSLLFVPLRDEGEVL
jgi:hypothetical protein